MRSFFCSNCRYIKIGDKECDLNPAFRLILHTKLANPHFQPELQAQCTLINFTVTRDGLEDQVFFFTLLFPWYSGDTSTVTSSIFLQLFG
uniref:Dynein heavy chain ATP-binding dynein motor region domain-containing protein n=1 Tax=Amazona collaria TaxID=241587 RepID=A0A8B9GDP5_9PSIT